MFYSWFAILPVLIVLISAFATRNVIFSLVLSIVSAVLLVNNFQIINSFWFALHKIYEQISMADHLYTFGFLILLGIFIQIMTHTGGIAAYSRTMRKYLSDGRSAQTMSLVLSCTFFLDDYLNTLTTGAIMKPLFDFYHISRVKLAFLLDSMSSALCVLVPATSWVALILIQLQATGIQDPFVLYLKSIPFIIYPLAIIFSAWFIVRARIMYGPMATYENVSAEITPATVLTDIPQQTAGISHFLFPLTFFIVALIFNFLLAGHSKLLGGNNTFQEILNSANIFWVLFISILATLIFSIIFFAYHKKITHILLLQSTQQGFILMKNSLLLLLLAWTLGALLKDDLHTGEYLANSLLTFLNFKLFPVLFFLITLLISASTGSAWGALVIMIPLALPLVINLAIPSLLALSCGSILAGAVAGCHFSPISDATVMASTSAGCQHLTHVQTQIMYSLPALLASIIMYIVLGFIAPLGYSTQLLLLPLYLLLTGILIMGLQKVFIKKS
ncbi:MAG: Na+/H+ antiporter NhaC family protein [Candidatus Babeliaceae bacterium]